MSLSKQFIILSIAVFFCQDLKAQTSKKFTLEPIYGIETRMVRYPEPSRYVTDAVYGVRLLYGLTIFSGEAEYTTTKSRKDYPSQNLKVEDSAERLSLGIRTTFPATRYVGAYFRVGGRWQRGESTLETNGSKETKDNPLRLDPYGGAGIQIAFHSNFALNAGATLIRNGEDKFDTQYTLGLSARFGNR